MRDKEERRHKEAMTPGTSRGGSKYSDEILFALFAGKLPLPWPTTSNPSAQEVCDLISEMAKDSAAHATLEEQSPTRGQQ